MGTTTIIPPYREIDLVLDDLEAPNLVIFSCSPNVYFMQYIFFNDFFETVAFNINLYSVQNNLTYF